VNVSAHKLDPARSTAIDIVEASYDLELDNSYWLPNLLETGAPILDFGLGFAGGLWAGQAPDGQPLIAQWCAAPGCADLLRRYTLAAQAAGPELVAQTAQANAGSLDVLSDSKDTWPRVYRALTENIGCKDMLTLFASDPDLHGATISIPSPTIIELSAQGRRHWQMLGIHITAGHRLRRNLIDINVEGVPATEMPLDAEALVDPTKFVVSQAAGDARGRKASELIRQAALRVDRARGKLRKTDPESALELWQGLVCGRWSLVDWFDTDGRRFVLAKPNAPKIIDPRGLTEREAQVATYAARGESGKLISYRLGLSPARVSTLLTSAMHKLGVKNRAELTDMMRGMPDQRSS